MKILYVSQYFPPEMGAPAARVAELSRHWVRHGHDVTVLTGFPNHPTGVVPPEYRRKLWRLISREEYDGVHVVRTWLWPFPNRRSYERMLNYGSFCISAAISGAFLRRADVVIASSPQLLVGLSGWWLAWLKRVPLIFEVRDLWPESLAAVGIAGEGSLLHRFLKKVASFLYRRSAHTVVVTPAFKDYLISKREIPAEKISIVPNGVDVEAFANSDSTSHIRTSLNLEGKFVVCYIGTIGMAHGLGTLVEAAANLQTSAPQVAFVVVGEGAEKESVMKMARSRELKNLHFVNEQPRESIPAFLHASDAAIVLLKRTELFKTVIPTKLLEAMACERPVILGVDGQAREILEQAQCGIFVEPENVEQIVQAVLRLCAHRDLASTMGKNGYRFVMRNFSRSETARNYLAVLEKVSGKAGA